MANTQHGAPEHGVSAADLWAVSAANCGYAVHSGMPLIGISGDVGEGFLVAVPAPAWFAHVATDGERDNAFRAVVGHALRVGQSKVKAAKEPTREIAEGGVKAAVDGSYKPSKDRSTDILDAESVRMFAAHIEALVRAKQPEAAAAVVANTVEKHAATDKGKAMIAANRAVIIERGTYTVSRKGKGKVTDTADISLD